MDNLRGQFPGHGGLHGPYPDDDLSDEDIGSDLPPAVIGQDERRMQVRAYNFWASLLKDQPFPPIASLQPEKVEDFGPYSVLLDFTKGIKDPGIGFVGANLALECGTDGSLRRLSDVPSRSLLSRITDHYMQIIANQAPIGFEAEFVNQRGMTILYRGILLPFTSDGSAIDFIYGVINWKELADQETTDELLLQIDQALDVKAKVRRDEVPHSGWADGPVDGAGILELEFPVLAEAEARDLPQPCFGAEAGLSDAIEAAAGQITDDAAADMDLAAWLASARELAQIAKGSEDRSRRALYGAIGRAHDFALAAAAAPGEFDLMVAQAGLTVQERAPMTPLVKLVFGPAYDKTRLTEYATVLGHARRIGISRGSLAAYLEGAPGGLKGVVATERRLRRAGSDDSQDRRKGPAAALATQLRTLEPCRLADLPAQGSEFTVVVARRLPSGEIVLLGEVGNDTTLVERAARLLLA